MKKFIFLVLLGVSLYADEVYATFVSKGIKEASLRISSSGIVDMIKVDVGSKVKKGDLLLKIQNNTQIENVKIQQAQSDANEQTYIFQKNQFERYEQSKAVVDKNTYEQIYSSFKSAENNYKMSLASLQLQKEILNNTYLKAPFDGVIAERMIEVGDGVSENGTDLFKLISNDIKLIIEFDSKYIDKVKVGDKYTFSIDGSEKKRSVTITKVYPSIDPTNRKLKAEALVKDMVSGVFGDGYITTK
ncbi:efflux RND transporter periplasmic adaptor subunit [Helicobacter sp. MIT 14-3879]|uniref:efflux RND transporter periplasmic adaptor subunit n=1 Tax=Helicobacter sp. MIT 14-3879 TaxID=2040649 RepID=UPI000E1F52CD|nr:efflux RND transporter periplasmic adaptor subunit [Helicobacter sp. MIT 14-3879]RDU64768.1 efflux transporter periplasmic adaptor subunit [Helicobacter sp. MIT 14-3879]